MRSLTVLKLTLCLMVALGSPRPALAEPDFLALSKDILIGDDDTRSRAAQIIVEEGGAGMIPSLVLLMRDRKSTRLNSSHPSRSRMPSSA